jgi:hypothetical protein
MDGVCDDLVELHWLQFFLKVAEGGRGADSPHLNNFSLIPTKPMMEGAKHLTRVTLKGTRGTWHSGREESYNNIKKTTT